MSTISEYSSVARGEACRGCGIKRGVRHYEFRSDGDALGSIPLDIPLCRSCVEKQRREAAMLKKGIKTENPMRAHADYP